MLNGEFWTAFGEGHNPARSGVRALARKGYMARSATVIDRRYIGFGGREKRGVRAQRASYTEIDGAEAGREGAARGTRGRARSPQKGEE